jgi:uncharacterized protein with beta-barrel porin domain
VVKLEIPSALAAAGLFSGVVLGTPALAQDATWLAAPGSGDFNTAANWTPVSVPTGTASFGASNTTTLSFSTDTSVGGFAFLPSAPTYSFVVLGSKTVTFTGAGIIGGNPFISINPGSNTINFDNASAAGGSTIINSGTLNFNDTATAASANITNRVFLNFNNSSTAGNATIDSQAFVTFNNSSTAGNSTITARGSLEFNDTSTAGNATITSRGSLDFNNSATAASSTITNNGTLDFNNSSTAGNATIGNAGILNFNDTATAANATITNNSTLNFNNSSTAGNSTITNDGILNFANTSTAGNATVTNDSIMIFGDASTAGSANITNTNTLNFSGTSTGGSAVINNALGGSVLFLGNSTAGNARLINALGGIIDFSASSGPAGNGKLSAGSIEGGGIFELGTNQLTVGSNNLSTTVSGVIQGNAGTLIKVGTGTMTLSGATNANDIALLVNGGTVEVDGVLVNSSQLVGRGGTLSGIGSIGFTQVNAGGTLAPGNAANPTGSLTANANLSFANGALYLVHVAGANASKISGDVAFLGGAVQAVVGSGASLTQSYDILHGNGINGTFSGVTAPNFAATLSYTTNDVFLTLNASALGAGSELNRNQQSVANGISNAVNAGGVLPTSLSGLFGLTGSSLANALTQVSGETATGSQQTTFNAMGMFMGLLTDPFMNRGGGAGGSPLSSGYAEENAYAAKSNPTDAFAMFTKAPPVAPSFEQRWSVWAAGFGGSQNTSGNVGLGSNNTTSSIAGTAVGADYLLSPNTIAGFALAGGGTSFSVANGGTGRSDLFQLGAYVRHNAGPAYISAALAYGWQDITTNRSITVAGLDQLRAQFNANAWSGRLEGGYRFVSPATGGIGITPYAAAQFVTFDLPAYVEQVVSGTNNFALGYNAKDVTDARSELGIRTDKSFLMPDGILTLRGRFAWAHDFDPDRSIAATFQTLPGASFVVNGAAMAADSALTTASVEMKWRNGWSVAGTFEGEFSNVTNSYAGKGVVRYQW